MPRSAMISAWVRVIVSANSPFAGFAGAVPIVAESRSLRILAVAVGSLGNLPVNVIL